MLLQDSATLVLLVAKKDYAIMRSFSDCNRKASIAKSFMLESLLVVREAYISDLIGNGIGTSTYNYKAIP